MTSLTPGFTSLNINNLAHNKGTKPYGECPELVSGEVQASCQSAFRQHMLKNDSIDDLMAVFESMPESDIGDRDTIDILVVNAAFALSSPCEDYNELFEYIYEKFDELDISVLQGCQDVTKWILDYNPINPYLAFKNSAVTNWGELNEVFSFHENLLQMAVIFDDVAMVKKISESSLVGNFRKNLCDALAKTVFDPLSNVRCWANMAKPAMIEIEIRIARQARALQMSTVSSQSMAWEFTGNNLYRIAPEIGSLTQFSSGEYDLLTLSTKSKDHMLRHTPGYSDLIRSYPELVESCLETAMIHDVPNIIPVLISDLKKAGVPEHQILYKHLDKRSPGEYLDKITCSDLEQQYVEDLLSFSANPKNQITRNYNLSIQVLLGFVDPNMIDKYAKTDVHLQSAYTVTGEKKYLERMSESSAHEQLGSDLGL